MKIPLVLAGALLCLGAGDAAAVVHVRAEQAERAERAAAQAAARADAEWVRTVGEIGAAVELTRRPLQQALDLDLLGSDVDDGVRYDVFIHGAVQAELQVRLDELTAIPVPEPRRRAHDALVGHLTRMKDHTTSMASPYQPDEEFASDADGLVGAMSAFRYAVPTQAVAPPQPPPAPASRAGMLYAWGEACARAVDRFEDLPTGDDLPLEQVRAGVLFEAELLETLVREMLAVEPLASDITRIENEVLVPLRGVAPSAQALRDLEAALGAEDVDALESALVDLDRTTPALEIVTRGLDGYGSSTCASYFDPGVLIGDGAPQDDPDVRQT